VAARLAAPVPPAGSGDGEPGGGESGGGGASGDDGRRIEMPTGYRMNPWADLQPAGDKAATGRKLWHQSPGSAG
ncbi:hypothetical protein, partial [Streptomyces zhihengii]|uniref:hypothetical protein n=1 Tax=Streptomyces zhihengii TaxID=1818004 RepID=UPI0033A10798